ncbi:hypothetical protein GGH92_000573 [Coemansia sp. RSA 2673]|nr:hypothetical protein GGH92_000573 [Coemansia sp. RSA 2673]
MLIVYKVVEYLEGSSKHSPIPNVSEHAKAKRALVDLFSVGGHWRMAALESICNVCHLSFNQSCKTFDMSLPVLPDDDFPLSWLSNAHLVKRAFMSITLEKILAEGLICAKLTRLWSEGAVFPTTKDLTVNLAIPSEQVPGSDYSPFLTSAEVLTSSQMLVVNFAHCLKQLVPTVANIHIFIPSITTTPTIFIPLYNLLISTLCQEGNKGIHVSAEPSTSPVLLNVQGLSRLTRISQEQNVACGPFARLAYHSANTLQALNINIGTEDDWRSLVYGGTDVPAIFCNLAKLVITIRDIPYVTTWTAIDHVVPFPVLSSLRLFGGYPFDDDLLFRGNGRTMKNLRLPYSALAKNAFGRFDILSRHGVSQMNSVCIGFVHVIDNAFLAARGDTAIGQQLLHLLDTTAALALSNDTSLRLMLATIQAAPATYALRCLDFGGLLFRISCLANVIAVLPSLVSLTCLVEDPDQPAGESEMSSRLSSFRAARYPLSECFKVLRVPYSEYLYTKDIACVAMHIAVVCPRFALVDIPHKYRNVFSREIASAKVNESFRPFASSISRLIV